MNFSGADKMKKCLKITSYQEHFLFNLNLNADTYSIDNANFWNMVLLSELRLPK